MAGPGGQVVRVQGRVLLQLKPRQCQVESESWRAFSADTFTTTNLHNLSTV